jgi:peptidoglycan/LPS O-acetylase OafA/YrhL
MANPVPSPLISWPRACLRPLLVGAALATFIAVGAFGPNSPPTAQAQGQRRTLAPELVGGTGWLGTDRPLSLQALRGKIVILEFWTSC